MRNWIQRLVGILLALSWSHFSADLTSSAEKSLLGVSPLVSDLQVFKYRGCICLMGRASDHDGVMKGRLVFIWGAIRGVAVVDSGGTFGFASLTSTSDGVVYARTSDAQGNLSNIAIGEFFE